MSLQKTIEKKIFAQKDISLCYTHKEMKSAGECSDCEYYFCADCLCRVGEEKDVMCKTCYDKKKLGEYTSSSIQYWGIFLLCAFLFGILALSILFMIVTGEFGFGSGELTALGMCVGSFLVMWWSKKTIDKMKAGIQKFPY